MIGLLGVAGLGAAGGYGYSKLGDSNQSKVKKVLDPAGLFNDPQGAQTYSSSGWTPEQQAMFQQLQGFLTPQLGQGQDALNRLLGGETAFGNADDKAMAFQSAQELFNPIAEYQRRQFATGTGPGSLSGIRERFGGSLSSSTAANAETKAGQDLEALLGAQLSQMQGSELASMRQANESALGRMLGAQQFTPQQLMAQLLSMQPTSTAVIPPQQNLFQQLGLQGSFSG